MTGTDKTEHTWWPQIVARAEAARARGLSFEAALLEGWKPFILDELAPAIYAFWRMGAPMPDADAVVQLILTDPRFAEFADPRLRRALSSYIEPSMDLLGSAPGDPVRVHE